MILSKKRIAVLTDATTPRKTDRCEDGVHYYKQKINEKKMLGGDENAARWL